MDWNWFFSSLAQSAAAIVGIFGAFIITKILSNQATFAEKQNQLKQLIAEAQKVEDNANDRRFHWYNRRTTEREIESARDIIEEGSQDDANAVYDELQFSPFLARAIVVAQLNELIEARKSRVAEEARRKAEAEADARAKNAKGLGMGFTRFSSPVGIRDAHYAPLHGLSIQSLTPKLNEERDLIDEVIRAARHHMRMCANFLETVRGNPESSRQIAISLGLITALFYFGVVYPLSFMPQSVGHDPQISVSGVLSVLFSLKGLLLLIVSAIFTGALGMFFFMNQRLKYNYLDVEALERFTHLASYSDYFGVMEENATLDRRLKSDRTNPDQGEAEGDG